MADLFDVAKAMADFSQSYAEGALIVSSTPQAATKTFHVNEGSTGTFYCTLTNGIPTDDYPDGEPIPGGTLTALSLTLFDESTEAIINKRDAQDVLNTNGVTVDANGLLTWGMEAEDNVIVTRKTAYSKHQERHVADFRWTWDGGEGTHRVFIAVQQVLPKTLGTP